MMDIKLSPVKLLHLFKQKGLTPRQSSGQHFLIDANIVGKILTAAFLRHGDEVVEIGPGLGALTLPMAGRGARILAIEIDPGLMEILQELFLDYPAVSLLQADALAVAWPSLLERYFPGRLPKLISNLPYAISSPLLYRFLELRFPFSMAVVMLQKEVAERLTAGPGDARYGSLSVLAQYYTEAKIEFGVSRNVFWPRPGVDSAVVTLTPRPSSLTDGEESLLWKVVRGVFQQRRKKIINGLLPLFPGKKEALEAALREAQLPPAIRPDNVAVEEFAKLCRMIYNMD